MQSANCKLAVQPTTLLLRFEFYFHGHFIFLGPVLQDLNRRISLINALFADYDSNHQGRLLLSPFFEGFFQLRPSKGRFFIDGIEALIFLGLAAAAHLDPKYWGVRIHFRLGRRFRVGRTGCVGRSRAAGLAKGPPPAARSADAAGPAQVEHPSSDQ
jgi:hypothetical protein